MSSPAIVCPECHIPAIKWFEFGEEADRHGYYHCDSCGKNCAVQELRDGRPGRQSAWVLPSAMASEGRQMTDALAPSDEVRS
jgi:hypothetical protein